MLHSLLRSLHDLWNMFLLLSPFLLMGLFLAGLLHVLVSKKQMNKIAGDQGMKSVFLAEFLGVFLPLCTCGVAPLAVELKRKGASKTAIIAYLITAPETAIDAILITLGLLGPAMAIARPISACFLGMLGGFFAIGILRDDDKTTPSLSHGHTHDHGDGHAHTHDHEHAHTRTDGHTHDHTHPHTHDHSHDHGHGHTHGGHACVTDPMADEPDYVGFRNCYRSIKQIPARCRKRIHTSPFFYSWYRADVSTPHHAASKSPALAPHTYTLSEIFRRVFNYSYARLADDILPGLLIGLTITFFIFLLLPEDLGKYGMSHGLLPYLIMSIAGAPLYVCASASTPIAAALVAKGLTPGAALVFLLTGPAVNITTVTILTRHFGKKFMSVYLGSVMAGGLTAGILFDCFLRAMDIHVQANIEPSKSGLASLLEWGAGFLLISLIIWRFWKGNLRESFHNMFLTIKTGLPRVNGLEPSSSWRDHFSFRSRLMRYILPLVICIYLATGFSIVPIGAVGYVRIFGRVAWRDLSPGLHYIPPHPFAHLDLWYPTFPRQVEVGLIRSKENKTNNGNSPSNQTRNLQQKTDPSLAASNNILATGEPSSASLQLPSQQENKSANPANTTPGITANAEDNSQNWHPAYSEKIDVGGIGFGADHKEDGSDSLQKNYTQKELNNDAASAVANEENSTDDPGRKQITAVDSAPFLSGDEFLADLVVSAQYFITDPYRYFYQINDPEKIIQDYLAMSIRDAAASGALLEMLTFKREEFEKAIIKNLLAFLNDLEKLGSGKPLISLLALNVVDMHPPHEALFAFRDVLSAEEGRETDNLKALKAMTEIIMRSNGDAQIEIQRAQALAFSEEAIAKGKSVDLIARAEVVAQHRNLLENLLWLQTSERALAKQELLLLPPGNPPQAFKLWKSAKGPKKTNSHEEKNGLSKSKSKETSHDKKK